MTDEGQSRSRRVWRALAIIALVLLTVVALWLTVCLLFDRLCPSEWFEVKPLGATVGVIDGLLLTLLLGLLVGSAIEFANRELEDSYQPKKLTAEQWRDWIALTETIRRPGKVLGVFEQVLFFVAFWIETPALIAGWLVFKVGSKWEVWSNVVKVPTKLDGYSELAGLEARHVWGSRVYGSFLIGTIANILIGFIGALVGKLVASG